MGGDDAVDESKLVLCCALCCVNLSTYPSADCLGCSGKSGICCLNCEFCCKVSVVEADCLHTKITSLGYSFLPSTIEPAPHFNLFAANQNSQPFIKNISQPGAPCLPCVCCGPKIECDGCSLCNTQSQCCCVVTSAALPCNDEVPCAVTVAGWTLFPKCGCMVPLKEIMNR